MNKPIILAVLLATVHLHSLADSSQCGFITDADLRAYCRATSGDGPSQCGFIRDQDLRALCMAEAGREPSQCGFIKNSDQRALCRARTSH